MGEQSTQALARNGAPSPSAIEAVIALGDLSKLTAEQRSAYYGRVCESLSLNPLTRPFEYLTLQGKLILYARKDATDQLRNLRKVSLTIAGREVVEGLYVVTARATLPDGRTDEEIGAVNIKGLQGDALANAMMKASTKAKRRVTLSICGLGMLDETETETIPGATVHVERPEIEQSMQRAIEAAKAVEVPESRRPYAEQSFAERTGAAPEMEGPAPAQPKPEPPKENPPADQEDLDAQFEELPSASGQPAAERTDPLWKQYRALIDAAQKAGLSPAEMRPDVTDSVLTDAVGKLKRALAAKSGATR